VSGQPHTPATLPLGKNTQYPFDTRLDGLQRWYGCDGKEKNFQLLPGIEPLSSSTHSGNMK